MGVRWWFPALAIGALGALALAWPASRPAEATSAPPPALASAARSRPVTSAGPLPAAAVAPLGKRVKLDEPIELRFDTVVDRASVERSLVIEPPSAGRFEWSNPRTLRFVPEGWRGGSTYRVSLSGPGLAPAAWQFRTRIPKPLAIVPGEGKPIVLTFDDGPHKKRQADRLLDVLRNHGARVVFFPTGRWARQRKDWVERAEREGHLVCNHSFSHRNLTEAWITEKDIRFEIENGAGHGKCAWFRPPLMAFDGRVTRVAKELGYALYFWDVDSRDWEDTPGLDIYNLVLARARPGAVVLLHMHAAGTHQALPHLLRRLLAAGYRVDHRDTEPPPVPPVGKGGTQSHLAVEAPVFTDSPTAL